MRFQFVTLIVSDLKFPAFSLVCHYNNYTIVRIIIIIAVSLSITEAPCIVMIRSEFVFDFRSVPCSFSVIQIIY
jgi:hypothetical protein